MKPFSKIIVCACAFAALCAMARAQTETTASLAGAITAADSRTPVAGANITLKLASTGDTLATRANASGQYFFAALRVDDGYTLTATAPGYATQTIGPFSLSLGEEKQLDIVFAAPKDEIVQLERMTVTARREQPLPGAATTLSETEIENRPASDQSTINDYATTDPRITMLATDPDDNGGDDEATIAAAGQNVRYNSIQIDGMRIDDMFGLSNSGLPSQDNPFSMETVQSISVDLAPYDVTRGGFTGASINAVTKSGNNTLAGSAYYTYRNERFNGPNLSPTARVRRTPFTSTTYGLTLGGPILKNRLFYFISCEHSNYTNPAPEIGFNPDPAALDRITTIAARYHYDAGSLTDPGRRARASDRYTAKIDWRINSQHRLTLAYNGSHGAQPMFARYGSTTGGTGTTSLSSHWYLSKRTLDSLSAQLLSKWTDTLQTQLSASRQRIVNNSEPDSIWPQLVIAGVPSADGGPDGTIYIGPNYLNQNRKTTTNVTQAQLNATLLLGKHRLQFGAAHIRSDFTDTYLPYAWGSYNFSTLDNFDLGYFSQYNYQRPLSAGNPIPTVDWGYSVETLFIQDTWRPHRTLTLTAGIRYDYPLMTDRPPENTPFEQTFGMSNTGNINAATTLGPRASFKWKPGPLDRLTLRGGAGVFQGRAPGAWLSNPFSNNGTYSQTRVTNGTTLDYRFLQNLDGTPVADPTRPPDWAATGTSAPVTMSLMKPGLRMPAVARGNLALDLQLPWQNITATIEWLYTRALNSLVYRDINLDQKTRAPDGRPIYSTWTISSTGNFTRDTNSQYLHLASPDGAVSFRDAYLLTNADRSKDNSQSSYLTLSLARRLRDHWGLAIAYTRGHATEVSAFTGSITTTNNNVAATNFARRVGVDPNSDETGASNTEVRDRILTTLTLQYTLIRNRPTTLSLVWDAHSGRPYSYAFANDANGDGTTTNDLFYVPSSRNDPKVYWPDPAQKDAFFAYLATNNSLRRYAGQIVPRNSETSPFIHRVDIHLAQQIPLYGSLRGEIVFDLLNLANLLNSNWGDTYYYTSYVKTIASGYYDARTNQYAYTFSSPKKQSLQSGASRWRAQLGFKLKF